MRINSNLVNPGSSDPTQAIESASQAGQTGQASKTQSGPHRGGSTDSVQISDAARQLTASDPSELGRLQAAVESRTYNVSPAQIANSIINAHTVGL